MPVSASICRPRCGARRARRQARRREISQDHATLESSRGGRRRRSQALAPRPGLGPASRAAGACALRLAVGPTRPAGHRRALAGADAGGQARHGRHALHLQVGDGRAGGGRRRHRCPRRRRSNGWSARRCSPPLLYGLTRVAMSLLVQVREGMFAKVAMHAVRKLALTTFEHMHRLSLRFHLERKTGGLTRVLERGRLGIENITRMTLMTFVPTIVEFALVLGRAALSVRLALRRRRHAHDRALPLVHGAGHRLAHQDPPHHERERHRGQHQGHRQPAQLRDREILRRRGARGPPLRSIDGHLRAGQRQGLHLACRAQCRTGRDLHRRAHRLHGHGRARHHGRHQDRRPLRDGQRADAAALHPAQLHGHGLPRDQAVADRHRAHDGRAGRDARGGGPAGRRAARGSRRHHPLRGREVLLRARAAHPRRPLLRGAGRQDGGDRRPLGRRQVHGVAHPAALLRRGRRPRHHRRPGHPRRHAGLAARGARRGAAGHRAVQRHHPLQHPLRPPRGHRRGGARGRAHGADRRLHRARCPRATTPWWASAA